MAKSVAATDAVFDAIRWWQANPWAPRAAAIAALWVATLLFVRFNARFFRALDDRTAAFDLHPRTLDRLDRTADAFACTIAFLLTLALMGVTGALWGALTALGVAGIIIGFAARDVFANLFAGFVLLVEHPFIPGDAIDVGGVGGVVKSVRLRSTVLTTWDGRQVTLPNSKFIDNSIVNYSANPTRRVEAKVAILHDSDATKAMAILREVADAYAARDKTRGIDVRVAELRESAIVLELWFWVPAASLFDALTHAFVDTTRRFQEAGIELAVPVRKSIGPWLATPSHPETNVVTIGEG